IRNRCAPGRFTESQTFGLASGPALSTMHVVVPGKVVEMSLGTRHDETRGKYRRTAASDPAFMRGLAAKPSTIEIKEIRTIVASETSATRAEEVPRKYERGNTACSSIGSHGR